MTSSLPDLSSSPPAVNDAAALTALLPAASASGSDSAATPEFATLMGASSGPAPTAAPAPGPNPPAGATPCPRPATRMLGTAVAVPSTPLADATVSLFGQPLSVTLNVSDAAGPVAPADETPAPAGPAEITRDQLEEAATFVASLLQTLLPGVQVQLPGLTGRSAPSVPAQGVPAGAPPAQEPAGNPAAFTVAADGAIELKLDLARLKPENFPLDPSAETAPLISAEWQRPGEATVRLEASASTEAPSATPPATAGVPARAEGRAIFAANFPGLKISVDTSDETGERKFVFTGDKQVKPASPLAGISVAKPESTMPVAPTEETRFSRKPENFSVLPLRAGFQVDAPPTERITVPTDEPAGQNFAGRAVDTVTSLVDTQFSASLQKSGSVQLRLRFGGEDLSVRVEVRDGNVRTDFHTDSASLRSALTREWQTMAAQSPEQALRYLDPVFSSSPAPAPATVATDTPSAFARHQQPQQDLPSRTPREPWADSASPFSRRSQLSDSFVPEPAAARVPAFLPTSQRLSVLA